MALLFNEKIDSMAFSDFGKNIATFSGVALGLVWERRVFDYSVEEGHWKRKILRFVLGLLGCVIILPLSKIVLKNLGLYNSITSTLRYFLATFGQVAYIQYLGVNLAFL